MGSEGWSRERWSDDKYWSVYRDDKGRIRARESARGPKGWFRKFPEPPEKPTWRVLEGYITGEGATPPGNVRIVRYVKSWDKPEPLGEQKVRSLLQMSEAEGDEKYPGMNMMSKLVKTIMSHGEWAAEPVERVDAVEVPAGYELGRNYVEVFMRNVGVYFWEAY